MDILMNSLMELVLSAVGILLFALTSYFVPRIKKWIASDSESKKMELIKDIADMGVELIEKEFEGESGERKFNEAATYVAMMANRYGYDDLSPEFIKGAVQAGWRRMEEKGEK